MRHKTFITVGMGILAILFVFGAVWGVTVGGVWIETRRVGYTNTMEVTGHKAPAGGEGGDVLLSRSLYTVISTIPSGDSAYTRGMSDKTYYSLDSTRNDTSRGLALDGFIGQTAQVNMFFLYEAAETLFVTVEQALTYQPAAFDSAVIYGVTGVKFNMGFKMTDTLFVDSLEASLDQFIVEASSSDSAAMHRFYTDSFVIQKPFIRIKIKNMENASVTDVPYHIELYVRQNNTVMGGASGRLQDRWQPKNSFTR